MKRLLFFLILLIFPGLLVGCGGESKKISEAKGVAEIYLKTLYRIEDYTKITDMEESLNIALKIGDNLKPYVTEDMYKLLLGYKVVSIPPELAVKYKANMEVGNIVFNKESIYEDTGVVTLDCTVTVKLKASDGTEVKSYNNRAIIQLKEEGDKYKINSDGGPLIDLKAENLHR